ncbi:FAD-binding oxidoreductase [Ktedonosporobacter rubrisoli]|uniref:FAD-binding oxidoreductase n=1 Tax=Ktedonosporobacter rubrisoli TaxID=2509675 RepID=A0A4P6JK96_KTERU|nr:FAD-dependent oxidoreductase [Ktedonosporobacter rubrisoli]QBD75569.1 FAD-binding oxidoreductase [Ktedonosporobacter rubrisoli]
MLPSFTELKKSITGQVIVPEDQTYTELRNVFNQAGSPAVIVRAQNKQDLITALRFAHEQHLALSVRSGGHGLSGQATNNGGIVLDLAAFKGVELLERSQNLVRIGAGTPWGEASRALADLGLALSSGDTNQVGVGGLTLGGGIGWLVRTYGLTIDSLVAAELITADGRILHVSADEHPDLFWAIRGGGGNFGIITSFEFVAQPCPTVVSGSVNYDIAEAETVLAGWTRAMREAPEELNSSLILFSGFGPQVPPRVMLQFCYAGDDEEAAHKAIKPFLYLGAVQMQDIQKKPYYTILEDAVSPPPSLKLVSHNGFLPTLSPEALSVLAANYGQPGKPIAQIRWLGGAFARVNSQATAFAHREAEALVIVPAFAPVSAPEAQAQKIRQAAWAPLAPLASGAFLNFLSDASPASVATTYPGPTYERLASIKANYDPDNVFQQNQNIKPLSSIQKDVRA